MSDQENTTQEMPEEPIIIDEEGHEAEPLSDDVKKHHKKNQRDVLGSLAWALILIWAGLVFLASNIGWLDQFQISQVLPTEIDVLGQRPWALIFLGAGVILFVEALLRIFIKDYREGSGGGFFLAAVFIGIGLSMISTWNLIWPFILIALGLATLISALVRHRK